MLNSIGIQNPGVEEFVLKILPKLEKYACKVIVNIYGETIEEYVEVAKVLNGCKKVSALEINASCPNVNKGGMAFGVDPVESAKLVESVKSVTDKPVIFKLTPNVSDPTEIAKAVERAGADGISAINTLLGMAIDIEKKKPRLAKVFGGLSGPAIKPVALRIVYQVANSVKVPVIGIGGISDWKDAVEFFLAGASAVQVGTANFYNPKVVVEINEGLSEYLKRHGYNNISELVGDLRI
jgi:dihydroorotate dehydrogenase (NAD+) catalytic subunit